MLGIYTYTQKQNIFFRGKYFNFVYAITKEYHLDRPMDIFNRLYVGGTHFFICLLSKYCISIVVGACFSLCEHSA